MKVLREPLLHFLLIGTVLFVAYIWFGERPREEAFEITIPAERIAHANWGFEQQWGRPPNDLEKEQIVDELVRDDVYYREALAQGLDKDDDAIRSRLRAKLEFISQDVSAIEEPSDEALAAFVREHPEDFPAPPRIGFRQVFVSQDSASAEVNIRISAIRERLMGNEADADPASLSDPSDLPFETETTSVRAIAGTFGDRFAERLVRLEPGQWSGPIESQRGLHFVYVTAREEGGSAALDDVYDFAKMVWLDKRRAELQEQAYARMRGKYEVHIERPADPQTGGDESIPPVSAP